MPEKKRVHSRSAHSSKKLKIPAPTPVRMPDAYSCSGTKNDFLSWEWVTNRIAKAHNYWVCTTRSDGRPHAMPVWAVWHEESVIFSTDPDSLKGRNLAARPNITVHLESGEEVVILEGPVEKVKLSDKVDDAYNKKYKMRLSTFPGPAGIYRLKPKVVMAWREKDFPGSSTRWEF